MNNMNFVGPEDDEELEETAAEETVQEETAEDSDGETPEENA